MPNMQEMAQSTRDALPTKDFALPAERKFPIQSAKQAMTALTYATWPDNKAHKAKVFAAVKKRWPDVWEKFNGKGGKKGRRRKRHESIGTLADKPGVRERLGAVRGLLTDSEQLGRPRDVPGAPEDPNSIAGMFAQASELTESKFRQRFTQPYQPAVVEIARKGAAGLATAIRGASDSVNKFLKWSQGQPQDTEFRQVMVQRVMNIQGHLMSAFGEAVALRDALKALGDTSKNYVSGPKYSERPR